MTAAPFINRGAPHAQEPQPKENGMPYYLTRDDGGRYRVETGEPPLHARNFAREIQAHKFALHQLLIERDQINDAIRETRRRIKACN